MHFLSILPTLFLAALMFSGPSQQTPVESLSPRDITENISFLVSGFDSARFVVRLALSAFNTIGNNPVKITLAPYFNATEIIVEGTRQRASGLIAISGELAITSVLNAESDFTTDLSSLCGVLSKKAQTFDWLTHKWLQDIWAALKVGVMALADSLYSDTDRDLAVDIKTRLGGIFLQADEDFKPKSGSVRG